MRFKRITKENGSIYNSTRERVYKRVAPSDGLLPFIYFVNQQVELHTAVADVNSTGIVRALTNKIIELKVNSHHSSTSFLNRLDSAL